MGTVIEGEWDEVFAVIKRSKFVLLFLFTLLTLMALVRYTLPSGPELSAATMLPFAFGCLAIGGVLMWKGTGASAGASYGAAVAGLSDRDGDGLGDFGVGAPGHDPVLDDGIVATHWLTREQLLSPRCALRSPLVLRSIDDFRRGIRFPLSCLQYVSPEPANAALRA